MGCKDHTANISDQTWLSLCMLLLLTFQKVLEATIVGRWFHVEMEKDKRDGYWFASGLTDW